MARRRAEPRDRTPPPPRMTGMSLAAKAMGGGFAAVIFAFVGAFAAGNAGKDLVSAQADRLGAGLCSALAAADPLDWAENNGTYEAAIKKVRREYKRANFDLAQFPAFPDPDGRKKLTGTDYNRSQWNKNSLKRAFDALSDDGLVLGFAIRFTASDATLTLKDVAAGVSPQGVQNPRRIGLVDIGSANVQIAGGGGRVRARIFHKECKTYAPSGDRKIADAYVMLSEAKIEAATPGGGMWLGLAPLLVGFAVFSVIFAVSQAGNAIKGLARDLDSISRGRLDLRVQTGAGGEVGLAQQTAARMASSLQDQMSGVAPVEVEGESQAELAAQVHASLQPKDTPSIPGYEVETLFKPGAEIGGDYFDYIEFDENRIALIIADCGESLRGVHAAMVMAMTRAYLKSAVDPSQPPSAWLKTVNRRLSRDLKAGMAVTAMAVLLDSSEGSIIAASAGHRPLLVWRKGKIAAINPSGIALGLDIGPVFDKTIEDKRLSLQKNDRIVLYTDGVTSAKNDEGEMYGDERFLESVRKQGGMNSAAFVNFAAGSVDRFLGDAVQGDDITISTLKRMK